MSPPRPGVVLLTITSVKFGRERGETEWRGLVSRRNPRKEYLLKVRKFLRLKCMWPQVSENSEMSGNFYSHLIKQLQ